MNKTVLMALLVAAAAIVAALEAFVVPSDDGAFLVTITFWTMMVQGCVALVAVGQLAKGIWLNPIKRDLLSFYPLLLVLAVLYLVIGLKMDVYRWLSHPTVWLETNFFVVRNFVLLLLCFFVGRALALAILKGSEKASVWAVWYVFLWVVSQSLVAFDWIMSLEYPWISTLFGAFFFIQSFLMGMLAAAFIIAVRMSRGDTGLTETLRDIGKMTLSFTFMWAGFLFAQYLVIWYGNLPEEVDYIVKRVGPSPYNVLSPVTLTAIFIIPFIVLVFRKVKTMPSVMVPLATMILLGIVLELWILVSPAVSVALPYMIVELLVLDAAFCLAWLKRDLFMPQEVAQGAVGGASPGLAPAPRT